MKPTAHFPLAPWLLAATPLLMVACSSDNNRNNADDGSDGPRSAPGNAALMAPPQHTLGDAGAGREVFRFGTFGNEGFWTDAMRLQQGIVAAGVTPRQALGLGLSVDAAAVPAAAVQQLMAELALDPTGATPTPGNTTTVLDDPASTVMLVNANAVIGLAAKNSNPDPGEPAGTIDVANGDKTGATCALCHTITDGSVFTAAGGGSIGARQDGRAAHHLDFGSVMALAENSRAYYPVLQLNLTANGSTTLGRAGHPGLTETSTEAEVDAFLRDKDSYPVGMFDDTFDGNGDPMHNAPLFRQDLAFPYGSEGGISKQDNFANLVYTGLLDPTTLTTPGGRAFINKLGGAAGDEIVADYLAVLAATGVTGPFPYIEVSAASVAQMGTEEFPLGVRVDNGMLEDLNAYLFSLPAPAGVKTDTAAISRGRQAFRTEGCTGCHNVDQALFVPTFIVPMATIFPGDSPVLLAERDPPLNDVLNTVDSIFDDKMAVVNASMRPDIMGVRGTAMPLLLDLARKPVFLHDNSVPSLDNLLDPVRGSQMPHPFYLDSATGRADMVTFLRSLDTGN